MVKAGSLLLTHWGSVTGAFPVVVVVVVSSTNHSANRTRTSLDPDDSLTTDGHVTTLSSHYNKQTNKQTRQKHAKNTTHKNIGQHGSDRTTTHTPLLTANTPMSPSILGEAWGPTLTRSDCPAE